MNSKKHIITIPNYIEEFVIISSIPTFLADPAGNILKLNQALLNLLRQKNEKLALQVYKGYLVNIFSEEEKTLVNSQLQKLSDIEITSCEIALQMEQLQIDPKTILSMQKIIVEDDFIVMGYIIPLEKSLHFHQPTNNRRSFKQDGLPEFKNLCYTINPEGSLIDSNREFFDLKNYIEADKTGKIDGTGKIDYLFNLLHQSDLNFIERVQNIDNSMAQTYSENEVFNNYQVRRTGFFNRSNQLESVSVFISHISEVDQTSELDVNSLKQQSAILNNFPYLAWLKDTQGRYISVNDVFAKYFEKSIDQIIGKTDHELFSQEIADKQELYDQEIRNHGVRKLTDDTWKINDESHWIEIYTAPVFAENGTLAGITGIARDISDRKAVENSIIENEEHFRALLQYSSDAITILDSEGFIVFESSLRNRISDFMIDELVGRPYQEIMHPEDVGILNEVMEEILLGPEVQIKREYRSLHKNKKWIYVESIFSNHLNNPSIKGIVVNTRDISDRKMSDLKERVYHDNLIFLSNSALELLGLSDRDDILKYIAEKLHGFLEDAIVIVSTFNEEVQEFTIRQIAGLSKLYMKISELIDVNPVDIKYSIKHLPYSPDTVGHITIFDGSFDELNLGIIKTTSIKAALKILQVNKIYNITMARDNKLLGNITILTLNKTIIKFKHIIETFVHQVSVALNRSQLELELVKAKTKAEESDMLKTAFLANMSHEIRTPMNGILGFAEMLNDEYLTDSNRKKYVEIINNNGKMLMNLIDDIIDFAKIEAGEIKILNQEFSLNALLTQVHSSFLSENLKKEKTEVKLRIRKALSNDECFIQTDPNRLRQVLTNLVGNSFKFTQKGYIEFGYKNPKDGIIEFYVKDTGIGIPKDKIDLIFERFVQGDYRVRENIVDPD